MTHDELVEMLEGLAARADMAALPPPQAHNAAPAEAHILLGVIEGLRVAGALPPEEIDRWRERAMAIARRFGEEWLAARKLADQADAESRRTGALGATAERVLAQALWTVEQTRTDAEAWVLRAEGAAHAVLQLGLTTFEDYVTWGQMFRDAADPPGELFDEISVDAGTLRLPTSQTVDLDLDADPWQLTGIDLLDQSVRVNLVQHQTGPQRHVQPRIVLSDDLGGQYRPSGSRSSGSATAKTWQAEFKPAPPPNAKALLLTVDQHRFRINFTADS